jgi:NDP-sugar pyrophosphorylase family protein
MRLLVLAGGFGTRLRTSIGDIPKALAPVPEEPFLQLQIESWVAQGLRNFTFLLYHQADQIVAFLQKQKIHYSGICEFDWVIEDQPLDTGGAVANAISRLDYRGEFLVINADTWLGAGIHDMETAVAPALAVVELENTDRYGRVSFDSELRITGFKEKSVGSGAGWISAGLCKLNSQYFEGWNGAACSMERKLYNSLVEEGNLTAVQLQCDFLDIGIASDYARFCNWVKEGRVESL